MTRSQNPADRRTPRQPRSKATVDALLQAIGLVLAERGLEGLTVRRVATRAGVALGSVYQYFPTNEALVKAWELRQLETMGKRLLEEVASAVANAVPLEDAVRQVSLVAIDEMAGFARHYRTSKSAFGSMHEFLPLIPPVARSVAGVLEHLPDRPLLRPADIAMALQVIIVSVGYGVVAMEKVNPSPEERAAWRASLAHMVVSFLVKDGGDRVPVG